MSNFTRNCEDTLYEKDFKLLINEMKVEAGKGKRKIVFSVSAFRYVDKKSNMATMSDGKTVEFTNGLIKYLGFQGYDVNAFDIDKISIQW